MGLLNLDPYQCSTGITLTDTYISFANETLYLTQGYGAPQGSETPTSYHLRANFRVYASKQARQEGRAFLDLQSVSVQITADQLAGNVYLLLYDELKRTRFPNTSDDLRGAPSAPAEPAPSVPAEPTPAEPAPAEPVPSVPAEPAEPSV